MKEYTLPLRVARSGTNLAAPDNMPWQAEACCPVRRAKDRRLPKVFFQRRPPCQIFDRFVTSFAFKIRRNQSTEYCSDIPPSSALYYKTIYFFCLLNFFMVPALPSLHPADRYLRPAYLPGGEGGFCHCTSCRRFRCRSVRCGQWRRRTDARNGYECHRK